jgi:hypothetical protein
MECWSTGELACWVFDITPSAPLHYSNLPSAIDTTKQAAFFGKCNIFGRLLKRVQRQGARKDKNESGNFRFQIS